MDNQTDTDQTRYLTPEWQAGEEEASRDIAAGNVTRHDDVDAFFRYLGLILEED